MTNGFLNMMGQISIKDVNEFIGDLAYQPLISIILPTFNSNLNFLTQAIESVKGNPTQIGNFVLPTTPRQIKFW